MEAIEQAPYRSVRHAMTRAFTGEERMVCKSPALLASRGGHTDMTPYDHAAQDAVVVGLIYSHCREPAVAAVTAQFMPESLTLARGYTLTKHGAIAMCTDHVGEHPVLRGYPRDYVADVVRLWAGVAPSRPEPDWMDALGKSARTLRAVKNGLGGGRGRKPRPGINTILDDLLDEAEHTMVPVMRERSLVP